MMTTNPLDLLPNFESFTYQIAIEPAGSRVSAWSKLRECERRLEMYKWVEKLNDPAKAQHRILLDDTASAFLLTFEATLQFLKEQFRQSPTVQNFDKWLAQQPQYDVTVRGLRTLRNLEAHIENKPIQSAIIAVIGGSRPDGTSATTVSRTWKLPHLQKADLNKLQTPRLEPADLNDWNTLVTKDAASIFTEGLRKLKKILEAAETQDDG